jgi:hypothetical protein
MRLRSLPIPGLMTLLAVLATGCSTVTPNSYAGLDSSSMLRANSAPGPTAPGVYRFAAQVDWRNYTRFVLDPVDIYRGQDDQFDGMSEHDRRELAQSMQETFTQHLSKRFIPTLQREPGTLRIQLTLTGASTTTPVLGVLTRFDLGGSVYNGVQAARGKEGLFSGWVAYAVEIYDAASHRLLAAYVTKQYPNAYNISANTGSLAAAKVGLDKGADELLTYLTTPQH